MEMDDRAHVDSVASLRKRRRRLPTESGLLESRFLASVYQRSCASRSSSAQVSPASLASCLGELDARDEARARRAQGELGVDVDEPRDVDDREEEVAELARRRARRARSRAPVAPRGASSSSSSPSSSRIFASGPSRSGQSNPTAAARRCTLRAWSRPGQRLGDVVEDARAPLLLGLDRLPALAHAAGRVRRPRRRTRAGGGGRASRAPRGRPPRGHRRPAPRAAARGSTSGRAGRRARRAASPGRRRTRRRRPRRPPRPCAARSSAPSAPGPRGSRGAGASSAPAGRRAPRRAARRPPAARAVSRWWSSRCRSLRRRREPGRVRDLLGEVRSWCRSSTS